MAVNKIPAVPETLLKKRKAAEKRTEDKKALAAEARQKRAASKELAFKRAEQYVNEYKQKEKDVIQAKRAARAAGDFYVPAEPKVFYVHRLRGINNIAPKPRKILQLLRLLQINNGVFVKVTKATANLLLRVEPFVTYGEPNLKSIRDLIYKRGHGKVNGQIIPLNSNVVVEENLGKYGINSIEDIVHEIATVGPHFKEVNNFLAPFHLSNPNGGFRPRKFTGFIEGGETGKREHFINKLIRATN